MSGIKFQMGHKRHFANESHLMASENDFSFDSYYSKIFKREKVSPSSSWNGKNTSEILYFRQNNQAMLSCHYLFVYWGKKENKNNHIKNQRYPNWKFGASIYNLQGFAAIWHLTFWLHGDFEPENLGSEEYKPCVYEIHDFTSTFLFSVETQHTIGEIGR